MFDSRDVPASSRQPEDEAKLLPPQQTAVGGRFLDIQEGLCWKTCRLFHLSAMPLRHLLASAPRGRGLAFGGILETFGLAASASADKIRHPHDAMPRSCLACPAQVLSLKHVNH